MEKKQFCCDPIGDCLQGKEQKNRIFPFLWLHGEPHSRLEQELDAIYNAGLRAFCVESRPHPQFCQEGWWEDLSFILQYAKSRNMQVWVLDDKHFPTGYANAALDSKYPHLRKKAVRIACVDVAGPRQDGCLVLPAMDENESLVSACAFRRTLEAEEVDGSSGRLLSVRDGLVFWDIPEGVWRVFYVISTQRGPAHFKNYIDMCDAQSCQVMLTEIYQPHYDRFSQYFGNTFQGFFSDEPCFANNIGSFSDTLGTPSLILPWREDMVSLLAHRAGLAEQEITLLLPALWFSVTGRTGALRLAYMDIVTELYRDNFSKMLGNWCQEKGIRYIGHVIEDLGAHMRLGYGCGHYFRAMEGQHMAGMDIVLHQIMPGITDRSHTYSTGSGRRAEPDFYHHTAAKLATSAAHLDPKKQGRTMCELYGAYGWAEGVPTMKYLTDFMLSGGINHFVPHAFSDKIEDPDCPPHFFNGGKNPQFRAFAQLMDYTARLSHILSSGEEAVPVAIWYNAESQWCAEGDSIDRASGVLGRAQTDYDFVPTDMLLTATAEGGLLRVQECLYQALLIPYGQVIPQKMAQCLQQLQNSGVQLLYLDRLPQLDEKGQPLTLSGEVIATEALAQKARQMGWCAVLTETPQPQLRVLRRIFKDQQLFFFHNTGVEKPVETAIKLPVQGAVTVYDAWENSLQSSDNPNRLTLLPGQAQLWCVQEHTDLPAATQLKWESLSLPSIRVVLEQDGQILAEETVCGETLCNYAHRYPDFGGTVHYYFSCDLTKVRSLRFAKVGETAELWIDTMLCGTAVQPPYEIALPKQFDGKHTVQLRVAVNQGYRYRDRYSAQLPLPPMGLQGAIEAARL